MSENDRVNALGLSVESQQRSPKDRRNIGGLAIRKTNGKGAYGAIVGELLYQHGGTYQWDMDHPMTGTALHDNIYQCMAADVYAPSAKIGIRRDIGCEYEGDIRSGVQSLSRWLDEHFGYPLYRCISRDKKNQVSVITVDPDFIVDDATGQTAREAQLIRNKEALRGQAISTLKHLSRSGDENAKAMLKLTIESLIDDATIEPPRRQLAIELFE